MKLSAAVVKAIQVSYEAKHELEAAQQKKGETAPLIIALTQARANERVAVKALDDHKKDHGC